jgi:hypothetical protein
MGRYFVAFNPGHLIPKIAVTWFRVYSIFKQWEMIAYAACVAARPKTPPDKQNGS